MRSFDRTLEAHRSLSACDQFGFKAAGLEHRFKRFIQLRSGRVEPLASGVSLMRSVICPTHLHFHDLASHFLALTAGDRFLRFGWVMTDVDIVTYVEGLLHSIGSVFVVVEPAPDISGVLQIEFTNGGADVGLSVSAWARGKGIGTLLLERAALLAGGRGVNTLFVRNLNFNAPLRRLAHRVGMQVAWSPGARSSLAGASAADEADAPHVPFAGAITLVDHSLRSQWSLAGCADAPVDELPETLPT